MYEISFLFIGRTAESSVILAQKPKQPVHKDTPFVQEYSIKYYFKEDTQPLKVYTDLNGATKVSTQSGLYQLYAGQFFYILHARKGCFLSPYFRQENC
ncbi:MAG: hypothetical protein R2822_30645 [Spirosomataceae bacterium]